MDESYDIVEHEGQQFAVVSLDWFEKISRDASLLNSLHRLGVDQWEHYTEACVEAYGTKEDPEGL